MGALASRGYLQQWRDRRWDPLPCFCSNAATVQVLFIFILQLHFLKLSCWNTLGFPGDPPSPPTARWHQLTGQAELQHSPGLHSAQLPTGPWGPLLPRGPGAPRVPAFLMSARRSGVGARPEELPNSWTRREESAAKKKFR